VKGINMKNNRLLLMILICAASLSIIASPVRAQEGEKHSESPKAVQRLGRAPVNQDILRVHLDRPSVHQLPNGLTVLILERHSLPTVNFSLWVRPGALADPKNLPGLGGFVADMLREGTATRTSAQLSQEIDSLGASLSAGVQPQSSRAVVSSAGLSNSTEHLLELMSDIALHPSFPDAELAKYKQREAAQLQQDRAEPSFLADEKLARVIYGDFPAAVVSPTPESVATVASADLKKYHDAYYVPGNAILGIAGDVQPGQVMTLVEKYFGGWQGAANPGPPLGQVPALGPSAIHLVNRPGSVQTNLLLGDYSLTRTDPEFPALTVMNRVLGGAASSRLFLNLREEKGYTYGAYSYFNSDIYPGVWQAETEVRNAVTGGSMHELMLELKRIQADPVPATELGEAERSIIASFALSLESPQQVLNDWLAAHYFGLPDDYWDNYTDTIGKVDAAAVQQAAKKYIDIPHLQVVAVGDAQLVKSALDEYGKVVVTDANGKPESK
jgi:zinc protease